MKKQKLLLRAVAFLAVLAAAYAAVQSGLRLDDYSIYSREQEFKQEKQGALDAVYIGSSQVFSFFEPPLAWNDYGIAVFDYAVPSMSCYALKYRVIEARKTQPDALIIINMNSFKAIDRTNQALHRNLDYMPWSMNKLELLNRLADTAEKSALDRLEFYFPIIRFHARWSELTQYDFVHPILGYKGAYDYGPFLRMITDTTDLVKRYDTAEALSEDRAQALDELLDYCDQEQVKVLFVTVPQVLQESEYAQVKAAEQAAMDRGYDCLDLLTSGGEFGVQPDTDFQDKGHLNIHGAMKYTDYLSRYLIEHYGFTDKRGDEAYASWDEAAVRYIDAISGDTLAFEREHSARDYVLAAPVLSGIQAEGQTIRFTWKSTEGADAYEIYRKSSSNGNWTLVDKVDHETAEYTQEDLEPGVTYYYTVVPVRSDGEATCYGNYNFAGIKETAKEGK